MKIKTSEATPNQINHLVAVCEGATHEWDSDKPFFWHCVACIRIGGHDVNYTPSTDWAQGGPVIERERISFVSPNEVIDEWEAIHPTQMNNESYGPTPLIAAMRCYVASKLGDEVDVPDELGEMK